MANSVPKVKLNNGYEIPVIGLGTYNVNFVIPFFQHIILFLVFLTNRKNS